MQRMLSKVNVEIQEKKSLPNSTLFWIFIQDFKHTPPSLIVYFESVNSCSPQLYIFTDKVPVGTRCTFENGWCGWKNSTEKQYTLKWKLNRGPTKNNKLSGPSYDHTFANETGSPLHTSTLIFKLSFSLHVLTLQRTH